MTSLLEFEAVSLGYGQAPVVSHVDLHVEPGEIVALLGRNGAGKTTTLLTASGLVAPMAGRVRLLGEEVDTRRPHRNAQRGLGHVPEGRCLFTRLTVAENLRAAASPSRIKQALMYFPMLQPLMGRRAGLLSGGEQQMLAIARALAAEPKVLLIDEMSLGLAPLMARAVLERLRVIVRDLGVGILIVEQFVHMILRAADRAYVYGDQGVALSGSAREVLTRMPEVEAAYLGRQA
jgi:branched-chain amino acid transport system ATP-binding protein